jgi:hypothetical protein
VAVVQYTFTHKQYTERQKKNKQYIEQHRKQYIEQHKNVIGTVRAVPRQIRAVPRQMRAVPRQCGPCPVSAGRSNNSWGFSLPHARRLRRFTLPDWRNIASSSNANLFITVWSPSIFSRKFQQKSYRFTLSVGFSSCRIRCQHAGRCWRFRKKNRQKVIFGTLSSLRGPHRFPRTTHQQLSNSLTTLWTHRRSAVSFAFTNSHCQ